MSIYGTGQTFPYRDMRRPELRKEAEKRRLPNIGDDPTADHLHLILTEHDQFERLKEVYAPPKKRRSSAKG